MAPASDWGKDTGLLNSGVSALRDPAMSELCDLTAVERGADGYVCASNFADVIKMLGLIDDVDDILDVLGALVLKGAAYVEDFRDRDRHLDDAAVLACAVTDPIGDRARMIGSDRRRIEALRKVLQDVDHKSWIATRTDTRRGHAAIRVLVSV